MTKLAGGLSRVYERAKPANPIPAVNSAATRARPEIKRRSTRGALATMSPLPPPLGFRAAVQRLAPTPEQGPFHWRHGLDVVFVMHGRVLLALDGGEQLDLQPGDCVIDNGTNHAWHNRFDEVTVLGTVGFGGFRCGVPPPSADRHPLQAGAAPA